MPKYYRGHNRNHAAFWVQFRELPYEKRFAAFINFFREIEDEVYLGKCTLREAGYALEPGEYDDALRGNLHGADMLVACDLASELAGWVFESREEAEEDWGQIELIMEKYL